MAQIQGQILADGNSEEEETRVSIRKKELEVIVHQVMEHKIMPKIFAIVKQELELAIEKHLTGLNHHSGIGVQSSESRTLQLQFMDKLSLPVLTRSLIKGEGTNPFTVALFDATTKQFVTSGREAFAKVEIVAVKGDFEGDNWTLEEFNNNIVGGKEGKKSLLTGNVHLNLEGGVGIVSEIYFTHNAHWRKACKLRLGAKVVDNLNGTRVREAVTEPFVLKDFRHTYTAKHNLPSPNDEVWRLKNIAKDGPYHNQLVGENIKTVKDFLIRYFINPESLQNVSIVVYSRSLGLVKDGNGQSPMLKHAEANKLVVSARENMGDVKTFDDETSLHSHLQLLKDACPSYSPMLERPSHYNCEPLQTHYGHNPTQPSSSSHNNQVLPFCLPDAANPSNVPTTDSLGIMSANPSFGNESYLNKHGLQNIPCTSSHDNQVVPSHLPNAANPSNIPSTNSLGIMSVVPSVGNGSYLNECDWDYRINEVFEIFPGNSFSPSLCFTEPMFNTEPMVNTDDLIEGFLSSPAADISIAQRRWSRLSNVMRSIRKFATSKIISSEAVPPPKRPRIH
ncbi:hypothetical protein Vadar_012172 [Vaccinium darrowii]|uniref:Uncharacterized protein n=1 Tax=Vaccinium darrowii TaxID=229202 RepID=A0ACB7ZK37_9ERIC|nr:hypothetical protein Vadar_012172 [Vaccinium darrowii]